MQTTTGRTDILSAARAEANTGLRERAREAIGLQIAIVSFLVIALSAIPAFGLRAAPIAGLGSVGQFVAITSAGVAAVAFILGLVAVSRSDEPRRLAFVDYIDVAAFAVAHAVIALLGWTLISVIVDEGLVGAQVFPLPVLLLSGATAGLTAYMSYFSATHLDLQLLATILAVFLVLGILASMLTASDPQWWKDNLSALGMTDDLSARTFNLTLIVAGVLVTTLARYATKDMRTEYPGGAAAVRTCLIIIGMFLACVGVFPVDQHFALHTGVASGMAATFAILVIALHWWLPDVTRTFLVLGYVFLISVVVLAVMFAVGYYTLTAVELIVGVMIFSWLILFIRAADAMTKDAAARS